ncbi:MAG: ATP synthase subunit I [Wujia sp.]
MEKPRVLKELYIGILITALFFFILGIIIMRPIWIFALGLLVGTVGACIWLYGMYDTLDRALDIGSKSAKGFAAFRSIVRLVFVMAVMIVAILIDWVAFVGVTVGFLTLKISALLNPLIRRLCDKLFDEENTSTTAETEVEAAHKDNELTEKIE